MKRILMRCVAVLAMLAGMTPVVSAQMTPQPLPMDGAVA